MSSLKMLRAASSGKPSPQQALSRSRHMSEPTSHNSHFCACVDLTCIHHKAVVTAMAFRTPGLQQDVYVRACVCE
eukprot:358311-Chlamydomonas_euryale.AAC.3